MTAATEIPTTAEFRSKLVAWLDDNNLSPPRDDHSLDAQHAQHARVLSALYDAGWMRWGWPESAGGLGGPAILRAVVGEEIVGRGLDEPGPYSMLEVLTPTMIDYARPELAAEMVPRLLSGRETWCQGFSEPGSGSDLASLSTRAEQRGNDWVVNGQKVWTSFAQYATRCVLLTRTGAPGTPNHEAITAFFVDLDSPGVTVRPLRTMHGVDEFCEVYFDDVVVPADRMLGLPGDGWRLAMDLLPLERSTCFWQRIAYLYSRFDRLIAETLVAIEGAEATLNAATDDFTSLLAKAAAGQAALTAAKHCQQVLGGIGFTAEHDLHRHVKRALVLDSLLGNARELTREAGAAVRAEGSAPRLANL